MKVKLLNPYLHEKGEHNRLGNDKGGWSMPGEEVELTASDARKLIDAGSAVETLVKASQAEVQKPAKTTKKTAKKAASK